MDETLRVNRLASLVEDAVDAFDLDLSGTVVFTEAATGHFAATAPAAALAGAESVIALASESQFGSTTDAIDHTEAVCGKLDCADPVEFVTEKTETHIGTADIVTNTGFVRPIDERMVSWMQGPSAVPLMYETWEFRNSDVDVAACFDKGIPVLGTDESDERLRTQRYLGPVALKLCLQNDIEVYRSRIVVIGGGRMARYAASTLEDAGATVTRAAHAAKDRSTADDAIQLESSELWAAVTDADAVLVVEHENETELIGPQGSIDPVDVSRSNDTVLVAHVAGNVDSAAIRDAGLHLVPETPADPGHMSYTTGYVGPKPVVDLNTAGLYVGELMVRQLREGSSVARTMDVLSDHPLVDDFSRTFKREHGLRPPSE